MHGTLQVYPLCFYLCQMKYLFCLKKKKCFLEQSENRTQEREEKKGTQSSHLSDSDQSRLGTKSEAETGDAKKKDNLTRQGQESQLDNVSYNVCVSARVCMFTHFF